jgi:3,4-dihydroxy-2-butanone 4-phosphate synthase
MVSDYSNTSPYGTAFCVSIARRNVSTGISDSIARKRSHGHRSEDQTTTSPSGHIFRCARVRR